MKTEPSERIRPYAATKKAPPLPPISLLCACPAASRCLAPLPSRKHLFMASLGIHHQFLPQDRRSSSTREPRRRRRRGRRRRGLHARVRLEEAPEAVLRAPVPWPCRM